MRIVNVMLARVRGGVESMALSYHRALKTVGFDVVSVGHPAGVLADGVPETEFRPLATYFNLDPLAALRLRGYLRAFDPDIVLTHGNRAAGLALLPLLGSAQKTVPVLHNQFFKGHLLRSRAAICVSANVMEAAKRALPRVPLLLLPNFADLEAAPVKPLPKGKLRIGALGRLHSQKGFDVLIRAARLLVERGIDFELQLAGDGEDEAMLRALVLELALQDHVFLCGWVSPVAPFLKTLDLFVVPSRFEPFGLVVIEAMAAGLPIIASALDGPKEILQNGRYGTLVEAEDPAALAVAIVSTLENPQAVSRQATAAQAHALSFYGFAAGALRLSQALTSL